MKIAFAHNVFDRFKTLKETISSERSFFPDACEYIACNSYKNDDFFNQIENLKYNYFFQTREHKIGCTNGLILSCSMALKDEFDVLVFSHDDVRLVSEYIETVNKHIESVYSNEFDIVYRNPAWIDVRYAMMEVIYMNRKAVEAMFLNVPLLKTDAEIGFFDGSISPEFWFYNKINNSKLTTNIIPYKPNDKMPSQIGFEHLNNGLRGWKD